jgi:hypothetical protein
VALVAGYGALLFTTAPLDAFGTTGVVNPLIGALSGLNLHHGYAGYWQADVVTWLSSGSIRTRPVMQDPSCAATQPGWFCPVPTNAIDAWFRPEPGPSFLLDDAGGPSLSRALPASLHPVQVIRVEPFTLYVFDHDIGVDAAANALGWPAAP